MHCSAWSGLAIPILTWGETGPPPIGGVIKSVRYAPIHKDNWFLEGWKIWIGSDPWGRAIASLWEGVLGGQGGDVVVQECGGGNHVN